MNPNLSRAFLFLDEWLGIFILLWLWLHQEWLMMAVFGAPWAVAVYAIGYPMLWRLSGEKPPAWLEKLTQRLP